MRNIVLQYYWLQNKYFVLLEATRKTIAIIDFADHLLEKTKLAKNFKFSRQTQLLHPNIGGLVLET